MIITMPTLTLFENKDVCVISPHPPILVQVRLQSYGVCARVSWRVSVDLFTSTEDEGLDDCQVLGCMDSQNYFALYMPSAVNRKS